MDESLDNLPGKGADSGLHAKVMFALLNTVRDALTALRDPRGDLTEEGAFLLSIETREQLRRYAHALAQTPITLG